MHAKEKLEILLIVTLLLAIIQYKKLVRVNVSVKRNRIHIIIYQNWQAFKIFASIGVFINNFKIR